MRSLNHLVLFMMALLMLSACGPGPGVDRSAAEILGNPEYLAISYGGYRHMSRQDSVPAVAELKEDMQILAAMGVRILRTYNSQQFAQASNLLKAIRELKEADPGFEMYVMLGAWIDCKGAWTDNTDHTTGDEVNNSAEIAAAVEMANEYPDIVKIIAVGNEAMVHWAGSYYVPAGVILKWVNYLQEMKAKGGLPGDLWITSSDNFASWGGDDSSYHTEDLTSLMKAVDYISMHTYPFHDSHYHPDYWLVPGAEEELSEMEIIDAAMLRARNYAREQYLRVRDYMASQGVEKPIHIGETGWASICGSLYGPGGTGAADEYKQKLYYEHMREWTAEEGISCFYFEAFDESWKDAGDPLGSENHFGLINLRGEAKYALWELVDEGVFKGLTRGGKPIDKTYGGDEDLILAELKTPPLAGGPSASRTHLVSEAREFGEPVSEEIYVLVQATPEAIGKDQAGYPSGALRMNAWEGSCHIEMSEDGGINVHTGAGGWWGCGLEVEADQPGEDLGRFSEGKLHFEIRGSSEAIFQLGFQSGHFSRGDQTNNFVLFGPGEKFVLTETWKAYSIPLKVLDRGANFQDIRSPLYLRADEGMDGEPIFLKNVYFTAR